MEQEFRSLLTGAASVTAQVAPLAINWVSHPQGVALPGLVLNLVDSADGLHMQGRNNLERGRIQIDCTAKTFAAAMQAMRSVRAVLHGYRGGGFRLITHVATRTGREGGTNEADRPARVSMDFTFAWRAQ